MLGFVIGAAFWHAVGFWNFVGKVVLKGTVDEVRHVRDVDPEVATRQRGRVAGETVVLATISADACISLSLDRSTGQIRPEPCIAQSMPLRVSRAGHREDSSIMPVRRNNVREAWATTVEPDAPPEPD